MKLRTNLHSSQVCEQMRFLEYEYTNQCFANYACANNCFDRGCNTNGSDGEDGDLPGHSDGETGGPGPSGQNIKQAEFNSKRKWKKLLSKKAYNYFVTSLFRFPLIFTKIIFFLFFQKT